MLSDPECHLSSSYRGPQCIAGFETARMDSDSGRPPPTVSVPRLQQFRGVEHQPEYCQAPPGAVSRISRNEEVREHPDSHKTIGIRDKG